MAHLNISANLIRGNAVIDHFVYGVIYPRVIPNKKEYNLPKINAYCPKGYLGTNLVWIPEIGWVGFNCMIDQDRKVVFSEPFIGPLSNPMISDFKNDGSLVVRTFDLYHGKKLGINICSSRDPSLRAGAVLYCPNCLSPVDCACDLSSVRNEFRHWCSNHCGYWKIDIKPVNMLSNIINNSHESITCPMCKRPITEREATSV